MTTEATETSTDTGQEQGSEEITSMLGGDATETKADEKTEQGSATGETDKSADTVSELEITLAEGVTIDEAMMAGFKDVAKEVGLDSEKATKLAAFYAEKQAAAMEAQTKAWEDQSKAWVGELKTEFGNEFKSASEAAKRAVREYGDADTVKSLAAAGLDNYPPLVKMLAKIGKAMGEDTTSTEKAKGTGSVQRSRDEELNQLYNKSGAKAP